MPATVDSTSAIEAPKTKNLSHSTLTEDVLLRAKEELNETDEMRETCLKELKILLKGEKNLRADTSDDFLLSFLRVKKFRVSAAFGMVKNYYAHRLSYPNLYADYLPHKNQKLMNSNICNFLPWRTSEDAALWVARIGSWDPKDFSIEELLRFGIMCHDKALQNPLTQICGITTIVDFEGFSWTHLLHLTPYMVRCFVSVSQDCLPIRHKDIHVVNNSSLFGLLFALIKPFITRKIRKRIHFHGYKLESLHEFLHPSLLPEEFGGTNGPFQNKQFCKSLLESEDEFLKNQKFGYVVSK